MFDSLEPHAQSSQRYRLVLEDAGAEVAEICSPSPTAALQLARRLYPGRRVAIFENDRALARVRSAGPAEWWIVETAERASENPYGK